MPVVREDAPENVPHDEGGPQAAVPEPERAPAPAAEPEPAPEPVPAAETAPAAEPEPAAVAAPAPGERRSPQAFRRVLLVIAGLVLGLGVYTANAQLVANNRMPMPFGVGVAVVLSGSMEPALHVDDVVVVRQADRIEVGDVVVYQSGGSLVVHRVKSIDGDSIVTRGDANDVDDAPVAASSVKGVVAFSVPAVGLLVRFLQSPIGIVAVLALVVVLVERSYSEGVRAHERELAEIEAEIRRLALH